MIETKKLTKNFGNLVAVSDLDQLSDGQRVKVVR